MIERGASILLMAHSEYRVVYSAIAKRLTTEVGAQVHIYGASDQETIYYRDRRRTTSSAIECAYRSAQPKEDFRFTAPPVDHMGNRTMFRRNRLFWRMLKAAEYRP